MCLKSLFLSDSNQMYGFSSIIFLFLGPIETRYSVHSLACCPPSRHLAIGFAAAMQASHPYLA